MIKKILCVLVVSLFLLEGSEIFAQRGGRGQGRRVERRTTENQGRRVERRDGRQDRRVERRDGRQDRRVERRDGRRHYAGRRHYRGHSRYYARGYRGYRGYGYYRPRAGYRYYRPGRIRPWYRARWRYAYGSPVYRIYWGTRYRYYTIPTRYEGVEHAVLLRHNESGENQVYNVYGRNPDEAADNALRYAHDTYGGGNFQVQWVRPTGDTGQAAPPADAPEEGQPEPQENQTQPQEQDNAQQEGQPQNQQENQAQPQEGDGEQE